MNHPIAKATISSFIALVLVYYSVAWVVLRCSHDEDFAHTDGAVADASAKVERISIVWDRIITRKRSEDFQIPCSSDIFPLTLLPA
jgi:hypothetical protein